MTDVVREALAEEIAALPLETRVERVATGYGVDLVCVDDISDRAEDTDAESVDSLRQDLYHRLITFELPGDSEDERDWGIDVRTFLHKGLTQRELFYVIGRVTEVLRKDDRVADVTATASETNGTLLITAHITPEDASQKEFSLIVTVAADGSTELEIE